MSESTREKYRRVYGKDYRTSNRPTKGYMHFLEEEISTLRADLQRVTRELLQAKTSEIYCMEKIGNLKDDWEKEHGKLLEAVSELSAVRQERDR
jgi:hypothetical protein